MSKKIYVTKASGKREPFSEEKVRRSIKRAGIPPEIEEQVAAQIKGTLYNNIPTREIYQNILGFLEKSSYPYGRGKYSLKQAIMNLGPSGYPFEKFLSEIFKSQAYQTEVGMTVKGKCAKHEIDIIVKNNRQCFLVECKFHNRPGIKTDIKIALYVKARFDDIMAAWKEKANGSVGFNQLWLATNTKFTRRAIRYGECIGIKLLGWNYPQGDSLRNWVEESGLHPTTCLFSLSQNQKIRILEEGIVLCRDLDKTDRQLLHGIGLSSDQIKKVLDEARLVCSSG